MMKAKGLDESSNDRFQYQPLLEFFRSFKANKRAEYSEIKKMDSLEGVLPIMD